MPDAIEANGTESTRQRLRATLKGLGRAFGGALIFALPMMMTMELWNLGFTMDRWRMVLLLILAVPLLVGVSHRIGFEETFSWRDDLRDALIALGIGMVATVAVLAALDLISLDMPPYEIVGKVAIEALPAALGALLGRSQFGNQPDAEGEDGEDDGRQALSGYFGTLFLMLVGALYFSLNMAPTDEMIVIAYTMSPWHAAMLVVASIALMHGFVFAVEFRGGAEADPLLPLWSNVIRYTLPGYILAAAISVYVLWTFGRMDGLGTAPTLMASIVLAFPAAIGAAAARLIL
jgi:putative integral membrane protein (TIGR02587 family)